MISSITCASACINRIWMRFRQMSGGVCETRFIRLICRGSSKRGLLSMIVRRVTFDPAHVFPMRLIIWRAVHFVAVHLSGYPLAFGRCLSDYLLAFDSARSIRCPASIPFLNAKFMARSISSDSRSLIAILSTSAVSPPSVSDADSSSLYRCSS